MAKKSQRRADGWKSKRWYNVVAPEMFGRSDIGETPSDSPDKLIGRVIETTLGDLTNDFSKQNTKLIFKIYNVDGNTAHSKFIGHNLTRDYMRSMVKRRTSRIDANTDVITSDGYTLRVKSSCFTVKRAKTSHIETIRKIMEDNIISRAKGLELSQYIQEIVLGKLSSDIYKEAKLVYPMRRVEIRKTEVKSEP
ncbi:MAG: 30S ribosomal protein S3ae [Halobacteriota archaeon]|nr:30S ribosomal protein S3ae [Halobacteriota archaeon]